MGGVSNKQLKCLVMIATISEWARTHGKAVSLMNLATKADKEIGRDNMIANITCMVNL